MKKPGFRPRLSNPRTYAVDRNPHAASPATNAGECQCQHLSRSLAPSSGVFRTQRWSAQRVGPYDCAAGGQRLSSNRYATSTFKGSSRLRFACTAVSCAHRPMSLDERSQRGQNAQRYIIQSLSRVGVGGRGGRMRLSGGPRPTPTPMQAGRGGTAVSVDRRITSGQVCSDRRCKGFCGDRDVDSRSTR